MVPQLGALLVCLASVASAHRAPAWTWGGVPASDRIVVAQDPMSIRRQTPSFRGGTAGSLPVGCGYTPDELVRWARTQMPDVQTAIDEFNRRGYLAIPAADTAVTGCAAGVPASLVALAFEKPGAFIDSFHVAAPTILVATRLHPVTGEPYTSVTGGMVVADGDAGVVFSGDSLSMFRATDPSFDVETRGSGIGPRGRITGAENWFTNPDSRFNQYLRCTGYGTVGCVGGVLAFGGQEFGRIKLAVLLEQPEVGLGILGGCLIGSAIGCIGGS